MTRALVDVSYGRLIPGAEVVATRARGPLRGLVLFAASVRADTIAVVRTESGWRALLVLRALLGRRRKLVALQFIVHPGQGRVWDRVDVWATRRALLAGVVLTTEEQRECAARYRLPAERFPHVPWPKRRTPATELPPEPAAPLVLSTGRAATDWPTLFDAAKDAGWPLTVVCSAEDRPLVERLNAAGVADVLSEIPAHEHEALMRRATVLAVVMREQGISQGQVRLMDAADAGVAVVCTAVRGVREYATDGATALLVPPRDPHALRGAVDRLLTDSGTRERLRRTAHEQSMTWTADDHLAAVAALLGVRFPHGHDTRKAHRRPDRRA